MFTFNDPIDYVTAVISGAATLVICWTLFGPALHNKLGLR